MKISKIDLDKIFVHADTSDKFRGVAEPHMDCWFDYLAKKVGDYDLGQLVLLENKFWLGALLWKRARRQSYPRDRWLGWHHCQQAERISLLIECVGFQPYLNGPGQPNYGTYALRAAMSVLRQQWEQVSGNNKVLFADTHLVARGGFLDCFQHNGWTRTTDKNPRAASSHWIKELVPNAKSIITARNLDKVYAGSASIYIDGLLPIKDDLLSSFKDAFKEVYDPRKKNRHYPLDSLLAIAFLSLISGATSINEIVNFSTRLSCNQAQLLGLPFNKDGSTFDLPQYHSYYRVLWRLDHMRLATSLIQWLNANMDRLPGVLHPDADVVRDTIFVFVNRFKGPPIKPFKRKFELPIGADPDNPGCLKRDANGNLIE